MQIDYKKASLLCTPAEFEILVGAKPAALAKLDPAEAKRWVSRARKAADKWRLQSRKQGASPDGLATRSLAKLGLFTEALARYEQKLAKLTAPAPAKKPAGTKPKAKKAGRNAEKAPPIVVAPRKAPVRDLAGKAERKAIGTDLRIAASGLNSRIRGHVSASGRRNQAARSSRKRS